ncbi:hypothetical protein B0T22DRAFT_199686 [Podospora appendiculata]|uniref:Uncharacterized protein n=1 Tax=Podospora appendiculata TaxID=314037 RepID=A0AAE0X4B9_9PEZI|nr:hypothetical protein B0T22DRAFT_199686 [Podospora appendiculata]
MATTNYIHPSRRNVHTAAIATGTGTENKRDRVECVRVHFMNSSQQHESANFSPLAVFMALHCQPHPYIFFSSPFVGGVSWVSLSVEASQCTHVLACRNWGEIIGIFLNHAMNTKGQVPFFHRHEGARHARISIQPFSDHHPSPPTHKRSQPHVPHSHLAVVKPQTHSKVKIYAIIHHSLDAQQDRHHDRGEEAREEHKSNRTPAILWTPAT